MTARQRQTRTVVALTAPAYLWLALTVFLPLAAMLYFSFLTVAPIGNRVPELTLANYTDFFTKYIYWYNAWRSFELGLWVTGICLVIGYPAAYFLAKRISGRWREALFLLIILPFWSNALVRTFSWTMVLRDPIDILFTYPAIVVGLVHAYLPYAILTIYVALQGVDDTLVEAARSLGATKVQAFLRVVLPLSMPGVLSAVFLIFIPVVGSFMEPRILGGKNAIMLGPTLGAALSFMMLAIVLAIIALFAPLIRRYARVG
jgi:spermidine/putrescine transport system permease protein